MDFAIIFILGVIIGGFLNLCICRIPMEKPIVFSSSHCENCKHNLKPIDLIPVFSYICLKGRCRYCNNKISIIYPVIELINGVLYLLIYLKFGLTLITLKYCILTSILIVIAMIDYYTQFVFANTIFFGVVMGVIFIIIQGFIDKNEVVQLVLGGIIGFCIIWAIVFISKGMGEGDIEIASVCGLFLGIKGILLGLFLAIIIGGVLGTIILSLKLKNPKEKIAFGPFIAIGCFISMFDGTEILRAYLNLFI